MYDNHYNLNIKPECIKCTLYSEKKVNIYNTLIVFIFGLHANTTDRQKHVYMIPIVWLQTSKQINHTDNQTNPTSPVELSS